MLQDPSVEAGRRAARYWNIDGFAELYVGLVWLFTPLFIYAASSSAEAVAVAPALIVGGTLAWMAAIVCGKRVIAAVKSRVTYPRTGYVACVKPKAKGYWFPCTPGPSAAGDALRAAANGHAVDGSGRSHDCHRGGVANGARSGFTFRAAFSWLWGARSVSPAWTSIPG